MHPAHRVPLAVDAARVDLVGARRSVRITVPSSCGCAPSSACGSWWAPARSAVDRAGSGGQGVDRSAAGVSPARHRAPPPPVGPRPSASAVPLGPRSSRGADSRGRSRRRKDRGAIADPPGVAEPCRPRRSRSGGPSSLGGPGISGVGSGAPRRDAALRGQPLDRRQRDRSPGRPVRARRGPRRRPCPARRPAAARPWPRVGARARGVPVAEGAGCARPTRWRATAAASAVGVVDAGGSVGGAGGTRRSRTSAACPATSRSGGSGRTRSASGAAGSPSKSITGQPCGGAQRLAEVQVAVDALGSASGRRSAATASKTARDRVDVAARARAPRRGGVQRCGPRRPRARPGRRAAAAERRGAARRARRPPSRRAGAPRRRSRRRPRRRASRASASRSRTLARASDQPSAECREVLQHPQRDRLAVRACPRRPPWSAATRRGPASAAPVQLQVRVEPGRARRKSLRMCASPKTTEVLDCSAPGRVEPCRVDHAPGSGTKCRSPTVSPSRTRVQEPGRDAGGSHRPS